MKPPLMTYVFIFFVWYLCISLALSFVLFLFNAYAYFVYFKSNLDFWMLFDDVYFKLIIFIPIISALFLTKLYFSKRQ